MRIRNEDDVVTRIPKLQDWAHVDQLVYLTEHGVGLPSDIPDYKGPGSVSDHHTDHYYERLLAQAERSANAEYLHCR